MKRVFIIFALLLSMVLKADAQIYTHKRVVDKFDDVLLDKDLKAIVTQTDSTFIIEEKGSVPTEYLILNFVPYNSEGDENNIANLTGNVYGYQKCWCVINIKDSTNYFKDFLICALENDENKKQSMIEKLIHNYCYYIVHRTVTSQYGSVYLSDYFWVQNADDGKRIVYCKFY